MTDTPNRVGLPSRSTESLDSVARTDGRTDRTNEETNYDELSFSPNASPAGGHQHFLGLGSVKHSCVPHAYVVYWPNLGVLKVGKSERVRWRAWAGRGAVEVATIDTCCLPHVGRIEQYILRHLAAHAERAFATKADSKVALKDGVGWTECYSLPVSPLRGQAPESDFDYERAYGLVLPSAVREAIQLFNPAWHPYHRRTA